MLQAVYRSQLDAVQDPNETLTEILGPAFGRYRQAWAEAEAGHRPPTPLHLDVDVTTTCNFQCPMCPAGADGHNFPGFQKGRFLDRALYTRALTEAAEFGLPSLRLGLTGEPLLVPGLENWVGQARAAGVLDISLITNGRLLTPRVSRGLIEAGLTRLMISVDAGSPAAYQKVRPGGDWRFLLQNINDFLELRRQYGSPLPLLRLSFVEMSVNRAERDQFIEKFAPLADYLSFQNYQNILGGPETDFGPADRRPLQSGFCPEPFTRLALQVDGGLFPCCSDFGRIKPLGNLAAGGLLAIWQSAEAASLAAAGADQLEPCRTCRQQAAIQMTSNTNSTSRLPLLDVELV